MFVACGMELVMLESVALLSSFMSPSVIERERQVTAQEKNSTSTNKKQSNSAKQKNSNSTNTLGFGAA